MGWWSTEIMGGDSPLDIEHEIKDLSSNLENEKLTIWLNENHEMLLEHFIKTGWEGYEELVYQVIGWLIVTNGGEFDETLKEKVLFYTINDSWAKEGEVERQINIDNFVNAINTYQGKPLVLKQTGLFEIINKKLNG